MEPSPTTPQEEAPSRLSIAAWVLSIGMLAALVVFIVRNFGEAQKFAMLARQAQPWWLSLAILFQLGTYLCSGALWRAAALKGGYRLSLPVLARVSVEQLSMNQLVPASGMSGTLLVVRALRKRGVPAPVAMQTLLVDGFSSNLALAALSVLTAVILGLSGRAHPFILVIIALLAVFYALIPVGIVWLLHHRTWKPPQWLRRRRFIRHLLDAIEDVDPAQVIDARLLLEVSVYCVLVWLLDAGTLWAALLSVGTTVNPLAAFCALIVATLAGNVTLLPGGLGTFEAACTATLTLFGAPVEAALTGTLLLRGLTLWLPLLPGGVRARQEIGGR
jgi:uncharacterized protein (TIRG00374 family)